MRGIGVWIGVPLLLGCVLWLGSLVRVCASDVAYYGVIKSIRYQQTNDTAPALLATNAYGFNAFVVEATNNVVTNATVKVGSNTPIPLLADSSDLSWQFQDQFNSQAALDSAYPAGTAFSPVSYTLTMSGLDDGVRTGSVNFFLFILALSYPATPQLTNAVAAQAVDPTRDFSLGWAPLGGGSLTLVQLTVVDALSNLVFSSPAPFQTGALNGGSTSFVIPAYSLPPGANLQGHLTVANPGTPNTNSYPGALGVAALAKDTEFPLSTRPAPPAPLLTIQAQPGQAQVQLLGESNRLYQLLATGDFVTWTNLLTTNSQTGAFYYVDTKAGTNRIRFYRAKVGQ